MKMILKHKFTVFIIIVFIVLVVFSFFVYEMFFSNNGRPIYGNRLDGIKEVEITDSQMSSHSSKIEGNDIVEAATGRLSGRTINFTIKLKTGTKAANAKSLANSVAELFSDKEKSYYDIQVLITNENDKEAGYPMIGYKNKNNKDFSFSAKKS